MIQGVVRSGCGRASKAFRPQRTMEVRRMFGWTPYPGTLNLRVGALAEVLASLPEPMALTEHETPIGPLRWWSALIRIPMLSEPVKGALVRGQNTKTGYLELVAPVNFRALGLKDGDPVSLELIER